MKYCKFIFLMIFLSSTSVFSQEKYIQHCVSKGETISEIAQKHNLKPSAIYELNPDAANGINLKTVLLIPTNSKPNKTVPTPEIANNLYEKTHLVLPKETLYGIAKQHTSTIDDLYKINPNLEKEGLKIGQTIKVPQTPAEVVESTVKTEKNTGIKKQNDSKKYITKEDTDVAPRLAETVNIETKAIEHEVLAKESLYSIAKKYRVKLSDLQKMNPELANKSLKVGQKITIPVKADFNRTSVADKVSNPDNDQKEQTKQTSVLQEQMFEKKKLEAQKIITAIVQTETDNQKTTNVIVHEVLRGESLYLIAKKYNISISDLRKSNAELGNESLKVGQKITVPVVTNSNFTGQKTVKENAVKTEKELSIVPAETTVAKDPEIEIKHQVLTKETLYGIAKKYGITIGELEKNNPSITKKLIVGSILNIKGSKYLDNAAPKENIIVSKDTSIIEPNENFDLISTSDAEFINQLISKASENIGTRYRSGGTTKEGFDCSGLMYYTFNSCNIKLPRSSFEMATYGTKIDTQDVRKGDLIFFRTRGSVHINHVGMVVEVTEDDIKFIHSATRGGVIISSSKESYYERNFAQVNRVL